MHKLEDMLKMLECAAHDELEKGPRNVNTDEIGKVVDMIKDISNALYHLEVYHSIKGDYKMTPEMYREHDAEYYRDMDKKNGLRYYTEMDSKNEHWGKAGVDYKNLMEYISENQEGTPEEKQMIRKHVDKYMNATWEDLQKLIEHLDAEERTVIKAKMSTMLSRF